MDKVHETWEISWDKMRSFISHKITATHPSSNMQILKKMYSAMIDFLCTSFESVFKFNFIVHHEDMLWNDFGGDRGCWTFHRISNVIRFSEGMKSFVIIYSLSHAYCSLYKMQNLNWAYLTNHPLHPHDFWTGSALYQDE